MALVATLSISRTTDAIGQGASQQQALVEGFHRGLLVAAASAVVNVIVTFTTARLLPDAEQIAKAAAIA